MTGPVGPCVPGASATSSSSRVLALSMTRDNRATAALCHATQPPWPGSAISKSRRWPAHASCARGVATPLPPGLVAQPAQYPTGAPSGGQRGFPVERTTAGPPGHGSPVEYGSPHLAAHMMYPALRHRRHVTRPHDRRHVGARQGSATQIPTRTSGRRSGRMPIAGLRGVLAWNRICQSPVPISLPRARTAKPTRATGEYESGNTTQVFLHILPSTLSHGALVWVVPGIKEAGIGASLDGFRA